MMFFHTIVKDVRCIRSVRFFTAIAMGFILFPAPLASAAEIEDFTGGKLSFFGIPLLSLSGGALQTILSIVAFLFVIAALVGGILIFVATLSEFKRVPRDVALSFGWNAMKKRKGFFFVVAFLVFFVSHINGVLLEAFKRYAPAQISFPLKEFHFYSFPYTGMEIVFLFIGFILAAYIAAGMIRISLAVAQKKTPRISELFISIRIFVPFLIGSAFFIIVLWAGLAFFLIPGILFASAFFFWQYRYLEGDCSLVNSFKDSFAMTRGARKEIFLFWYLCQVIVVLGILVLGIGYFFSFTVSAIALAFAYISLKEQQKNSYGKESLTKT